MLERLLPDGPREAGIYAQAYRLLDASNMIAYLFAGLLLPMFAHMLKHHQDIRQLLQLSYSLIAVPAIIAGCVAINYGKEIMNLLYHEHVEESSEVFSMLMSCFLAISTTYIFGTLLTANGNLRQLNIMAAGGMVFNIVVNFLLIPSLHAKGAAAASLVTQFGTALMQVLLCIKIFKLKTDFILLAKLAVFTAGAFFLNKVMSESNIQWVYSLLIAITGCVILALATRLINFRKMIHILQTDPQ
jgi:O-antigen/teichoic acid export membrane protein